MNKRRLYPGQVFFSVFICLILISSEITAQTPGNSLFHEKELYLPYANIMIINDNGDMENLPFTPVIVNQSPVGIKNYSNNINITGSLVFAGNGIVDNENNYNAYRDYDLQGRVAVIVYNDPEDYKKKYGPLSDLHVRAYNAEIRGAEALIVFGFPDNPGWNEPFIELPETAPPINIPVFTVAYQAAKTLLKEANVFIDEKRNNIVPISGDIPVDIPLVAKISIIGDFGKIKGSKNDIMFLPGILDTQNMENFVYNRETAVYALSELIEIPESWIPLEEEVYFPDYVSFKFYTNLTDFDMNSKCKVFPLFNALKHPKKNAEFHIHASIAEKIIIKNWSESDPMITRGTAVMLAYYSTEVPENNMDILIVEWLKENSLMPLLNVLDPGKEFNSLEIDTAEVVASSFFKYLYSIYGLEKYREFYSKILEKSSLKDKLIMFDDLYMRDIITLQREWLEMLSFAYAVPQEKVNTYLRFSESKISEIIKN
ncbi:PA domain-containing protein [candidate division KSB1 bacterium]